MVIAKDILFDSGAGGGSDVLSIGSSSIGGSVTNKGSGGGNDQCLVSASRIGGGISFTTGGEQTTFSVESGSAVKGPVRIVHTGTLGNFMSIVGDSTISGPVTVISGAANDLMSVDAFLAGDLKLKLGEGNNSLIVNGASSIGSNVAFTSGTGMADLEIVADSAIAGSLTLTAPTSTAAADIDLNSVSVGGKVSLATGSGDDTLDVATFTALGKFTAKLGDGLNMTGLGGVSASAFSFKGGSGRDVISVGFVSSPGAFKVAVGDGTSALFLAGFVKTLNFTGGTGLDYVQMDNLFVSGATTITMGAGRMNVYVDNSRFGGAFTVTGDGDAGNQFVINNFTNDGVPTIFGGAFTSKSRVGNDEIFLGLDADDRGVFLGPAKFNGGAGANTLRDDFAVFLFPPVIKNFTVV